MTQEQQARDTFRHGAQHQERLTARQVAYLCGDAESNNALPMIIEDDRARRGTPIARVLVQAVIDHRLRSVTPLLTLAQGDKRKDPTTVTIDRDDFLEYLQSDDAPEAFRRSPAATWAGYSEEAQS